MTHCDRCGREQDWLPGYLKAGRIRTRCAECARPEGDAIREAVALTEEMAFGRARWKTRAGVRLKRRRQ